MNRLLSLFFISFALCAHTASATDFGYSNGEVGRSKSTVFRLGSNPRQGIAMRIPSEKLAALDGHNISSIGAAFGTRNIDAGTMRLFITHDLNADPMVLQAATYDKALQWCDFKLDSPITINAADGDLYIGYYAELPTTASLLVGDKTDTSADMVFGILDDKWVDIHNQGYGNPALKFTVDDAPAVTDIILRPIDFNVYMKVGSEYGFSGMLYNYGTEPIKDFDLSIQIGDGTPESTHFGGLNISQCESLKFDLPTLSSTAEGSKTIKVEISNINGASDADNSDNAFDMSAFFYPENMERNILLEGFTGMACVNCPSGHNTIHNFLQSNPDVPVIEVMHHSGYQPDLLTNDFTQEYTFFYGSNVTYAPAVMVNRTTVPEIGSVPVMNTTNSNLSKAFDYVLEKEPYMSLALETEFDESTRLLKMQLKSYVHNDLPSADNAFNILLIQDNMTNEYFYQSGAGTGYVHTNVNRGGAMGTNPWGISIPAERTKAGSEIVWKGEYTIPSGYTTTYMSGSSIPEIPALPEDMYLVAYTGSFGEMPADRNIYNSIKVKVGDSLSQNGMVAGIGSVATENKDANIYYADGMIIVEGGYDSLSVYNMEGRQVGVSDLTTGIYVVKAVKGNTTVTKKIAVR